MAVLKHLGKYQGYPLTGVEFRRSPGMQPEYGWVEIDYGQLKSIKMDPKTIGWRATVKEVGGPISITAWYETVARDTVTTPPRLPELKPPPGQLACFGDLVLSTRSKGGKTSKPVRYTDIYVATSGTEEVFRDLNHPGGHNEGAVRIPITDIRDWYSRVGVVIADINVKLNGNAWDPATVQKSGEPWPLKMVLMFLFSQLPGSPSIDTDSPLFTLKENPPTNLTYRGELARDCIEDLLQRNGLEASMLSNNAWYVGPRGSTVLQEGQLPTDGGGTISVSEVYTGYQKKSVSRSFRPPMVGVMGGRRITRMTAPYIAVFHDLDGRVYKLEDIEKVTGYPLSRLNKQVLLNSTDAFMDAPGRGSKHLEYKKIFRDEAYKLYAPSYLFSPSFKRTAGLPGASVASGAVSGIPWLADRDFDRLEWLPIVNYPAYGYETSIVSETVKPVATEKGDLDELFILPPTVRASRLEQGYYGSFAEVRILFKQQIEELDKVRRYYLNQVAYAFDEIKFAANTVQTASRRAPETFLTQEAQEKYRAEIEGKGIELDKDLAATFQAFGMRFVDGVVLEKKMNDFCWAWLRHAELWQGHVNRWNEQIKLIDKSKEDIRAEFKAFENVYATHGGIEGWFNAPWGFMTPGSYSLNPVNGLLKLAEPAVLVRQALALEKANLEVIGQAPVSVTFGYERKTNTTADWTLNLYAADPADSSADPEVFWVGLARSTPVKMALTRSPETRLYENESGMPMNLTSVISDGMTKARQLLKRPLVMEGFSYEIDGFVPVEPTKGVSSVQYIFDGDVAKTYVAVNSEKANLPLGAPDGGRHDGRSPVSTSEGFKLQDARPV